jgi:hypothetical protein
LRKQETILIPFNQAALLTVNFISKFFFCLIILSLGVINFKNGDKYRGSFKDGRPCGYGTMKYNYSLPGSNGSEFEEATYEGLWKAGKREG